MERCPQWGAHPDNPRHRALSSFGQCWPGFFQRQPHAPCLWASGGTQDTTCRLTNNIISYRAMTNVFMINLHSHLKALIGKTGNSPSKLILLVCMSICLFDASFELSMYEPVDLSSSSLCKCACREKEPTCFGNESLQVWRWTLGFGL